MKLPLGPIDRPSPVEALVRALVGGADEDERDERASTFARGLALGAIVGAAIAGSTIWQRRHARATPVGPTAAKPVGDDSGSGSSAAG